MTNYTATLVGNWNLFLSIQRKTNFQLLVNLYAIFRDEKGKWSLVTEEYVAFGILLLQIANIPFELSASARTSEEMDGTLPRIASFENT